MAKPPDAITMPLGDVVSEAARLIEVAGDDLLLRVMGGVGVRLRCPDVASRPGLTRDYQDIDLVARRRDGRAIRTMLAERGYVPHERFNALRGSTRLLFFDEINGRQLDVFLSTFEMCQKLELEQRLQFPGPACTASDLLLMKLQIIELNAKDILDATTLLLGHQVEFSDQDDAISIDYLRRICGSDWGWYTTLIDNLALVADAGAKLLRDPREADLLTSRVRALTTAIENGEKTLKWRLRDRVGRRRSWYELPEEVDR